VLFFLQKNGLGFISGDFFINSSGHPESLPKRLLSVIVKPLDLNLLKNANTRENVFQVTKRLFCCQHPEFDGCTLSSFLLRTEFFSTVYHHNF
jgi:hypothetical protein